MTLKNSKTLLFILFSVFVIVHIVLFNINAAEWGDSYRILRASEYVRDFDYPSNEKRPPLYSILLALRPEGVDQVFWGRGFMFVLSVVSFWVYYLVCREFFSGNQKKILTSLLLFSFNPVYLYWSIRIMGDVPLAFFVLLAVLILLVENRKLGKKSNTHFSYKHSLLLGFIVGLSVLTRFEGYILFGAVGLGIMFFSNSLNKVEAFGKNSLKDNLSFVSRVTNNLKSMFAHAFSSFKVQFFSILTYVLSFVVTISPYIYYRNPFRSSYFEEPSGRVYDINTFLIFCLSALFLFGFVYAYYFLFINRKKVRDLALSHISISSFIIVEFILVLAWPAAVPRLFVATVPLVILFLSDSIIEYFTNKKLNASMFSLSLFNLGLLGVYGLGQYVYKLQFLVLMKPLFIFVFLLSLIQLFTVYKKNFSLFISSLVVIILVWSISSIWIHKDIYKTIVDASVYIVNNLEGNVGYNDVGSVSEWYFNDSRKNPHVKGFYYDLVIDKNKEYDRLVEKDIDYVLLTSEHNYFLEVDINKIPHMREVALFEEEINGRVFSTKVIKFVR